MSRYTAINCMDGRVQIPVIEFIKKKCSVEFVDAITEAGPVLYLSEQKDQGIIEDIFRWIDISLHKNHSKGIAIVGHYDCKGNPADKQTQLRQIRESVKFLKIHYPNIEFIGLWVNENWEVVEVD